MKNVKLERMCQLIDGQEIVDLIEALKTEINSLEEELYQSELANNDLRDEVKELEDRLVEEEAKRSHV